MTDGQELRPVCFMVMPFRKRKVTGGAREGAPNELDCDRLWDRAYRPAIEEAGFTPIRADFDTGAVIVKDMLERLAFADLVIADVSLPNGNVYYEVGLRHVAKERGCILFAASWSKQLFDIDQFRSARYDLADGDVPDDEAKNIQRSIFEAIEKYKGSKTPWHVLVNNPEDNAKRETVFREFAEQLSSFQARVRAARITADKDAKKAKIQELVETLPESAFEISDVAIEMLFLVRDELGWQKTLDFVDKLPATTRDVPVIQEQRLLALGNAGQPEEAIASLEELIRQHGESPERLGIIGGRYKRLWRAARDERLAAGKKQLSQAERQHLNSAIDAYTRGMELDYNQFYCSSNIAQLLLARGRQGDTEKAEIVDHFVVAACERAIARDEDDEWTRQTLLSAAFRARDLDKCEEFAERIRDEGAAIWQLESTLLDLKDAVERVKDTDEGATLNAIYLDLNKLNDDALPTA